MQSIVKDPFDGKTPFDDDNQMRELTNAILISQDNECSESGARTLRTACARIALATQRRGTAGSD